MMKHKAMILFILVLIVMLVNMKFQTATAHANVNHVRIPDQAIRLRILANSNTNRDQTIKRQVRDAVNLEVATWVHGLKSIHLARKAIRSHIPEIKRTVAKALKHHHVNQSFKVTFGDVQFPTKIYGNNIYPAGIYEAVLITLGKGRGANWWCVLFPPLCFLDFQNGDAVQTSGHPEGVATDSTPSHTPQQKSDHIHVKFFIVEWLGAALSEVGHLLGNLF